MLEQLFALIQDRKQNPKPGSYTNSLFEAGLPRMAQKVGEEGTEGWWWLPWLRTTPAWLKKLPT